MNFEIKSNSFLVARVPGALRLLEDSRIPFEEQEDHIRVLPVESEIQLQSELWEFYHSMEDLSSYLLPGESMNARGDATEGERKNWFSMPCSSGEDARLTYPPQN